MAKAVDFIKRSVESRVPSNTFIVLDTHSDDRNGFLLVGGSQRCPQHSLTSDVVDRFCGEALAGAMGRAAEEALQAEPPRGDDWYSDSAFFRGGWRGLLLATCSPVMRMDASFHNVRGLVERYVPSLPCMSQFKALTGRTATSSTLSWDSRARLPSRLRSEAR